MKACTLSKLTHQVGVQVFYEQRKLYHLTTIPLYFLFSPHFWLKPFLVTAAVEGTSQCRRWTVFASSSVSVAAAAVAKESDSGVAVFLQFVGEGPGTEVDVAACISLCCLFSCKSTRRIPATTVCFQELLCNIFPAVGVSGCLIHVTFFRHPRRAGADDLYGELVDSSPDRMTLGSQLGSILWTWPSMLRSSEWQTCWLSELILDVLCWVLYSATRCQDAAQASQV